MRLFAMMLLTLMTVNGALAAAPYCSGPDCPLPPPDKNCCGPGECR